jgi:glycosyltransferase involved in cell wall biosynthesis
MTQPGIHLVITIALKKELPYNWLESNNVPVYTLAALKSGALNIPSHSSGIISVITGAGLKAGSEAACWIRDHIKPLYVVNIGTCGLTCRSIPLKQWVRPMHIADEQGNIFEPDSRLPFMHSEKVLNVNSLISVSKPAMGDIPLSWKAHDAIDMEGYSQAKSIHDTGISFHCIKFSTDYSSKSAVVDFNKNLSLFHHAFKDILSFIEQRPVKIAAIVPVYNREHTIGRAVDSILAQSCRPDEIIVVDDASTDGTTALLRKYGNKIKLVCLPVNSGPSKARNEGIRQADADWLAFMDSDDCWEKDKLRAQAAFLKKYPFYEIIQSEEIWIRSGVRVNQCRHHRKTAGWIWEPSLERCLVSPSGVLISKKLIMKYGGFDESLPVCEDYDLWLKISRFHPVGLDSTLSVIKYGGHSDQLSRHYPAMDGFRVTSLLRLLENESDPVFRQKIIRVLKKKLGILINGCKKRNKFNTEESYRKILESLK